MQSFANSDNEERKQLILSQHILLPTILSIVEQYTHPLNTSQKILWFVNQYKNSGDKSQKYIFKLKFRLTSISIRTVKYPTEIMREYNPKTKVFSTRILQDIYGDYIYFEVINNKEYSGMSVTDFIPFVEEIIEINPKLLKKSNIQFQDNIKQWLVEFDD